MRGAMHDEQLCVHGAFFVCLWAWELGIFRENDVCKKGKLC
jgi:hypothetical protein